MAWVNFVFHPRQGTRSSELSANVFSQAETLGGDEHDPEKRLPSDFTDGKVRVPKVA